MLLNQCLAISLSPTASGSQVQQEQSSSRRLEFEVNEQNLASKSNENSAGKHQSIFEDDSVRNQRQRVRPDSTLFEQLIAHNSASRINNKTTDLDAKNANQEKVQALREALDRVEFAGFVVPSWLLLSGSYNDLHCIKTSWSEGNFKSPDGFKIETIGK